MATRVPQVVPDRDTLYAIVRNAENSDAKIVDLNGLDVQLVTDMSYLFASTHRLFDIAEWDTSNVETMEGMFDSSSFNADISRWNVSNVKTMRGMFRNSLFNGDISGWNTGSLSNASQMFRETHFRGDISRWDTSRLENCASMFYHVNWEPPISGWLLPSATSLDYMLDDNVAACMSEPTVFHWYDALKNDACLPGNEATWLAQHKGIAQGLFTDLAQQANCLHTLWLQEHGLNRTLSGRAEAIPFDFTAP